MISPEKALNNLAGMCSRKEYCSQDIRAKLSEWDIYGSEAEQIMDFLYKHKFIDDSRFVTFYARDKFRFNKWGKQKIRQMLQAKGINSDLISEALRQLDGTDYGKTCTALLAQKLKSIRDTDPYKIKAKLIRFAAGRGFDFDTIHRSLEELPLGRTEDREEDF